MSTFILKVILLISCGLSFVILFLYRGNNWPFNQQALEALIACGIISLGTCLYILAVRKTKIGQQKMIKWGLYLGLLWTMEIAMNNVLQPPLPQRDIYDDLFWAIIAIVIFILSTGSSYQSNHVSDGIKTGFWSGLASGAVACLTALIVIVFGMPYILSDALNVAEWSARGASSGIPTMSVYFAYQTLAGAFLHLLVLGVGMGLLLGLLGGIQGKGIKKILSYSRR